MREPRRPDLRNLRVFVVEDHGDTLEAVRMYLEHSGCTVLCARSKAQALKHIPIANCDVLISDIYLPDGNAWDLIRELGDASPHYAIAMSGFGAKSDREKSAEVGFRHHLVKPVEPKELCDLLEEAILRVENE